MRFGRFQGLVLSLFLPAFYRDVARNWGGIGILYVLLLYTLTWIPALVNMQLGVQKFAQEDFPKFAKNLPDITIQEWQGILAGRTAAGDQRRARQCRFRARYDGQNQDTGPDAGHDPRHRNENSSAG